MKRKIAVIATDFLKTFICEMLDELDMGFEYEIFTYKKFDDIKEVYLKITDDFDGILTSGSFPAHMIRLYYKNEQRPVNFFNTDDTAMYRLLLSLLQHDRNLDFKRVYADIVELFGGDLTAFVEGKEALPDISTLSETEFSPERMERLEEEQFEKHLKLWKEGKTDLSITRFSSIVSRLEEAGVKVYFPYPGEKYVRDVCTYLLEQIEQQELKARQPGIVIIRLFAGTGQDTLLGELDSRYIRLENDMMEYLGNSMMDYSMRKYHYGLEIVASRKQLSEWTEDETRDKIGAYIKSRRPSWSYGIGYGIGNGLAQTRLNALNACHEAEIQRNTSYLIDEHEQMIGPLGESEEMLLRVENASQSNIQSSLSPITVAKTFAAFEASGQKEITAQELSFRLGVTKRSANRILSTLEQEGWVQVAYKKRSTSRGRPESVFVRTHKTSGEM